MNRADGRSMVHKPKGVKIVRPVKRRAEEYVIGEKGEAA